MKLLYLEAVQAKASDNHIGEILASKNGDRNSVQNDDKEVREETANKAEYMTNDKENVVWQAFCKSYTFMVIWYGMVGVLYMLHCIKRLRIGV